MERLTNFIGGEFRAPSSEKYLDNFNPATGEVLNLCPLSDERDVNIAVDAAKSVFNLWSEKTPAETRNHIVLRLAHLIRDNFELLTKAETDDTGKPITLSKILDIPRAAKNLEFFANFNSLDHTEAYVSDKMFNYTVREPLGVVGIISPWNLPLYLLTWKIAPALVTGNCVVAKPSEMTPYTAYLFSRLCKDAGLPDGVLNIVHGLGVDVGKAISNHPDISAVSFTGSTVTGRDILHQASQSFKKVSLEMGGKNPTIVFADCDFEQALDGVLRSAYSNQGQICLCGSRIYVDEQIYVEFTKALTEKIKALRVGDPQEPATEQGSLVSKVHFQKVMGYLDLAKSEGGRVLAGGQARRMTGRCGKGWFVEPTLYEGLSHRCRTNREEIFGPVATIQSFKSVDEVCEIANSVDYGLSASIWTQNISKAQTLAKNLKCGVVWINSWMLRDLRVPFGGKKNSGMGREGGLESLRFFTDYKTICYPGAE